MTNNRKNKRLLPVIGALLLSMIMGMFMATAVLADDGEPKNEISSIKLNKKKTDITIEIRLTEEFVKDNKADEMYLFELYPYQSTSELDGIAPVKTFKTAEKVTVKLPYYIDNTSNRLYSKFVVAQKVSGGAFKLVTSAKYIENIEILAANSEPFPVGSSKKGLIIDSLSDAQHLGVQHTVVDVPINELMHGENVASASSIHHNGQTFYIDTIGMAKLEHTVKSYSDAGIAVYLNLVLTEPDSNTHEKILNFYYNDITYGAKYYALNTRNEYAMKAFQAFLDYICYRFTNPEHTHGFVPGIIVGFEVNSNRTGNSAGPMDMSSYTYAYTTAFRMVYTALRSNYSEGRVYVSLGNNWTSNISDLTIIPDSLLDYPAKDFLDVFNAAIKNSGDIPWGISVNPYASAENISYWNDSKATDTSKTEFITMKNIGVLTDYLSEEDYLYDGKVRSVIIGEFGASGRPLDTAALNYQAAGLALAYYTAQKNEHIDAFIYRSQTDDSAEAPYYGLRAYDAGNTPVSAKAKQPTYDVFRLIDTDKSEEVTEFVESTVGEDVFSEVMGNKVKYKEFNERKVIEGTAADKESYDGKYKTKMLFRFTDDTLSGFYFSDNADYIELQKDEDSSSVLYARLGGVPAEYKGISNTNVGTALKKARYITLDIKAEGPDDNAKLKVMLLLQRDGDAKQKLTVYEGTASVTANTWSEVTFNIKDFVKSTDGKTDVMKILVCTEDGSAVDGAYGIWLRDVTLHNSKGMPVIVKILLGILIAAVLLVAAYGVLYLRAQIINRKRRAQRDRQRREMLRRQQLQYQQQQLQRQNGGAVRGQHQPMYGAGQGQRQPMQGSGMQGQRQPMQGSGMQGQRQPMQGAAQGQQYRSGQNRNVPQGGAPNRGANPNGNTQVFSTSQINRINRGQ